MRKNSRKGFTIVELVIVIAVIAILAAVLIPTFSGIIDKANTSADIQLIREANMLIQAEMIDLDRSLTKKEADKVLTDNGIDISKVTNTANVFYYLEEESQYVIFNLEDKKMTYPENIVEKYKDKAVSSWLKYDLTLDYIKADREFSHEDKENRQYLNTGFQVDWDKSFTIKTKVKITGSGTCTVFSAYNSKSAGALVVEVTSNELIVWMNGEYQCGNGKNYIPVSNERPLTVEYHWDAINDTFTVKATQDNGTSTTRSGKVNNMPEKSETTIWLGKDERTDGSKDGYKTVTVSSFEITIHDVGYDESITLPPVTDNIDNYTFSGWQFGESKLEGNKTITMPAKDTTITAKLGS